MDAATGRIRFNPFLPYWAVLQTDLRETAASWAYRLWVAVFALGAGAFLLYKFGVYRETGVVQLPTVSTFALLRGVGVGGLALVALLSVSAVSSERSSVADAVLCRGISRHQYFMAKWHARMAVVVTTFVAIAAPVLALHAALFDSLVTPDGAAVAIALVALGLTAVVSWGVTVGALANSTIASVTGFWLVLYGGGALTALLPASYPSPDRVLSRLPFVLHGEYDLGVVARVAAVAAAVSLAAAVVGLIGFGRKDV
jgi:ABC-2 type transport system permease protein